MARMPGAVWLGEHSPRTLMTRYDIVCVHTIVGYAPAHAAHFSVKADGTIQQSRDTRYRSAANLYGNHRIIAIENEDHGAAFGNWSGSDVPVLTDAQVAANARILRWVHETHGVPLQMCPNSRPTSRGLAYHRQGCDGNFGSYRFPGRVSGGEVWSSAFGKVCPGDRRIAQLPDILALAKGSSTPSTPTVPQEDDVAAEDIWEWDGIPNPFPEQQKKNPKLEPKWAISHALNHAREANRKATRTEAKVDALIKSLEALVPGVEAAAAKAVAEALAKGIDITVTAGDDQ